MQPDPPKVNPLSGSPSLAVAVAVSQYACRSLLSLSLSIRIWLSLSVSLPGHISPMVQTPCCHGAAAELASSTTRLDITISTGRGVLRLVPAQSASAARDALSAPVAAQVSVHCSAMSQSCQRRDTAEAVSDNAGLFTSARCVARLAALQAAGGSHGSNN